MGVLLGYDHNDSFRYCAGKVDVDGSRSVKQCKLGNGRQLRYFNVYFPHGRHPFSYFRSAPNLTCPCMGLEIITFYSIIFIEVGNKKPHTSGKGYVKTPATCTTKGVKAWDCTVCGAEAFYTEEIPALNHKNTEIVNVKPTCTEDGAIIKKCKDCGKELEKSVVPAIGHKWSEYTKAAKDCIPGEKGLKCLNCGATKDVTVVKAPKDHTAGEYTQTKAPTCTEKGEEVSKCTVCGKVLNTREVAAKGHTAGEWITVRQPSASQEGKMIQKCTVCGAQIGKKYIRATGTTTAAKTVAYVAGTEVANYAKIDLTVDATTELDLVSANGAKVGKLVVEVKEGKVTVKYELSAVPADAFLTFVTEAPAKDIHAQKEFEFEKAISVADELAGAAAAYIYVEIEY